MKALYRTASWLMIVLAVAAILVLLVVPRLTGGATLTVLSGSMSPAIPAGSVVVVRPVETATIEPGDVVTYQIRPDEPTFVTHRVIDIDRSATPRLFTMKGDANRGADSDLVPAPAIRGEVWLTVPHVGTAAHFVRSPSGMRFLGIALLATLALSGIRTGLSSRRARVEAALDSDDHADANRPPVPSDTAMADVPRATWPPSRPSRAPGSAPR